MNKHKITTAEEGKERRKKSWNVIACTILFKVILKRMMHNQNNRFYEGKRKI